MNTIILISNIGACFYCFTYCQWLKKNGNRFGAIGLSFLIVISLALNIYKIYRDLS